MIDQKTKNFLAVFSAGYMKRFLDGSFYDKIFNTEFGKKIKGLDKRIGYGIECGLNLLTAFFDQKLAEDTALKKFLKEVGVDVGPEISKRLIQNARENIINHAESPEDKELINILLELDDQALINLLNWLYRVDAKERTEIVKHLSHLSLDEITKLAQLSPENMERFFRLFQPPCSEKSTDKMSNKLKSLNERWESWLNEKKRGKERE